PTVLTRARPRSPVRPPARPLYPAPPTPARPAHGRLPEWSKGAVCKTAGSAYVGSNPTPATRSTFAPRRGRGRRTLRLGSCGPVDGSSPAGDRRARRGRHPRRRRPARCLPVAGSLMLVGSAAWAIDAVAKAAWCIEFQHDVGMGTWLHPIGVNWVLVIHNRVSVVLRWWQRSFWSPPHPQLGLPDEPIFRPAWSSMDLVSPTLAGCEGGRPSAGPFTAG